jgi:hypothetical protein
LDSNYIGATHVVIKTTILVTKSGGSGVLVEPVGGNFSWGRVGQYTSKGLLVLCIGMSGYNIYAVEDRYRAVAKEAGGWIGAFAVGSKFTAIGLAAAGPWGAFAGGLIGMVVGGMAGSSMGDNMYGGIDMSLTLTLNDQFMQIKQFMFDPNSGQLLFGGVDKNSLVNQRIEHIIGGASLEEFAYALRCVYHEGRDPAFSLDGWDRNDPFGPYQRKVYMPKSMWGTVFGEILFEADYLLKELSLGKITNADDSSSPRSSASVLSGWMNEFEIGGSASASMHRMWIVIRNVEVKRSKQAIVANSESVNQPFGISVTNVELAVCCCALELNPTSDSGVKDKQITDSGSAAARFICCSSHSTHA